MRLVDHFIQNPVKVAVGVILLVLFGTLTIIPPSIAPSPLRAPVQLTPNTDEPIVTVSTAWEGAAPEEVEREILEKQEDMLKAVNNVKKMTGTATQGAASIELEFEVGTDQDVAKQDVSDALRQVKYQIPQNEFDNPTVKSGREFGEEAIAWMILSSDRDDLYVPDLYTFIWEDVKPFLERVDGIASVAVFGGREREIQVVVDPHALAGAGITFEELQGALVSQNTNVAAGNSSQGKRDIVIRTMGRYESLEDIRQTVIKVGPGGPIRVGHIAEVKDSFKKEYGFVRSQGKFVIAIPAFRRTGANVIEAMEGLKKAIHEVNDTILAPRGLKLDLTQVYDETTYIHSSIDLVKSNIIWGGLLAIAVLLVFLRSLSATFIVAVSIPICVIGTFLIIPMTDRTINVIMLAGLAFAVGMVVDNAIVVLENIYRHREMGKSAWQAASDGATEVWGAVLANTLTTVIVFLPIVFVKGEAGQLFQDIAIAISGAVSLSLVISITVIPVLCSRLLAKARMASELDRSPVAEGLGRLVGWMNSSWLLRLAVVLGMTGLSYYGSVWLAPKPTYLPAGNRNLIFGFLITPPGFNTVEMEHMAHQLEEGDPERGLIGIRPFWETKEGTPEYDQLMQRWSAIVERNGVAPKQAQIDQFEATLKDPKAKKSDRRIAGQRIQELRREIAEWRLTPPLIENFFYVAMNGNVFMGCSSRDSENVKPLKNVLGSSGFGLVDVIPIFFQFSIFRGESGNTIDVEVRGDNLDSVISSARNLQLAASMRLGCYVEANPRNFATERREDQFVPDRVKAGDVGMTTSQLGSIIRACGDGRVVGQYREGGRSIDLTLKVRDTEDAKTGRSATSVISGVPVYTPAGSVVPLSSLCDLRRTTAPEEIRHIEKQQAVKLTVHLPESIPLPEGMDTIENELVSKMREGGYGDMKLKVDPGIAVRLAGNANKLQVAWDSLKWLLLLSFLICFLLMAGLFESFAYPFVIILTVPLAVVGGFVGLAIVHQWTLDNAAMAIQQLDILTILGFVILLGIVVNNGILIVHQALNFMREGMEPQAAISASVTSRLRPILMTVLTTLAGQLMLVIRPGSGAEMYRGIGAVVLGGLACSTLFTLFVVPAMLSMFVSVKSIVGGKVFSQHDVAPVAPGVLEHGVEAAAPRSA